MAFLTESLLREKAKGFQKTASDSSEYLTESIYKTGITVFLSHSHKDEELVKGLIELLAEQDIYIYVDWNDSSMSRITSGETARKIKKRIQELRLFFFLATENGLNSKWCPWELGVADSFKKWENILIIPVADPSGHFEGNEYLQIYKHLEVTLDKKAYVVDPGFIKTGEELLGEKLLFESAMKNDGGISLKDFLSERARA